MEVIKVYPDGLNPGITLDVLHQKFEVYGKSCPEDAVDYYRPIVNWLEDYKAEALEKTVFEFNLSYYNTVSSKVFYTLLNKLQEIYELGNDVVIRWFYPEEDELHKEAAAEFAALIDVPMEIVPVKD